MGSLFRGVGKGGVKGADDMVILGTSTIKGTGGATLVVSAIKPGIKVSQVSIKPISTEALSPVVSKAVSNLQKSYPTSTLASAGKAVKGQITFTRVAVITGGVIAAVILINPETGEQISEALLDAGTAIVKPFIPSIISCCVAVFCLISLAFGGYMVMQQMS